MATLMNADQKILLSDLIVADTMWSRGKGLLGTKDLASNKGIWLKPGNSIHTFFMNYAIDCIFVDSKLQVKALIPNVQPGKMIWPIWSAKSVIEVKAGVLSQLNLQVGDQLHVGA
ncbi:MAG: DUF192 domain-containing protein [Pseudobdellovibrionaceae bacterium]